MNKTNKRLTFNKPDGSFGVVGMNCSNEDKKLYSCVAKLKDFEDIGFNPEELTSLKTILKEHKTSLGQLISNLKEI